MPTLNHINVPIWKILPVPIFPGGRTKPPQDKTPSDKTPSLFFARVGQNLPP